ncbi:MAG: hypothetical protein GX781_06200 [Clostridiales bacterium]|nr:hypothetical protein [Clostridiales bacterium]
MFGRRADGRALRSTDDPVVALTPYLMPMRCDAQVMLKLQIDYERIARYIVDKGVAGNKMSFMDVIFASYVRIISQIPELNRFVVNKRMYVRNELNISFIVLREGPDGKVQENVVQCKFDPHDTIFDVAARTSQAILEGRKADTDNTTVKIAKYLLNPLMANFIVGTGRLMDRYGLLPRAVLEASPFHTSMFFTNMMSIGMPAVFHHIYNFGTCSLFVSLGSVERSVILNQKGEPQRKRYLPLGITADERVCAGHLYAKMVSMFNEFLHDPSLLEKAPDQVFHDQGMVYSMPAAPKKRELRKLRRAQRKKHRIRF